MKLITVKQGNVKFQVDKYDSLPKTVCEKCIERLNVQYNLVQRIRKSVAIKRTHRLLHVSFQLCACVF